MKLRWTRFISLVLLLFLVGGVFLWWNNLMMAVTGYAAVVNGEPIYVEEVKAQNTLPENQSLQALIAERLLMQQVAKSGISVSDEDVTAFLINEAIRLNASLEDMLMLIGDQRDLVRKQLMLATYLNQTVLHGIAVTGEEAKNYYDNHLDEFLMPEQVHVGHILVRPEGKSRSKLDTILQTIIDTLRNGEPFDALARQYSEDESSRRMGGDLGYIIHGQTVPEFEKVAFSTPINTTSVTFKTQFGFHVLKVYNKIPSRILAYDEIEDNLRFLLLARKQQEAFLQHLNELQANAKIRVYLR